MSLQTLAWSPSGAEVWFSAPGAGELMGVTLDGHPRVVARFPGWMLLHDVAHTGAALVSRFDRRWGIIGAGPGETRERELSWRSNSLAIDISRDGKRLLFSDQSIDYTVALREMSGGYPVRLAEGYPLRLSPDGEWVAVGQGESALLLVPTGPGESRWIPLSGVKFLNGGFFPDSERIWITGSKDGQPPRSYAFSLEGDLLGPITEEGHRVFGVSPDGEWLAARCPDGPELHAVSGGETRSLRGLQSEKFLQWKTDGRSLFVAPPPTGSAIEVFLLDVETGERTLWKEIGPPNRPGMLGAENLLINPDGTAYAYSYDSILSELYVVEGLR